MTIESTIVADGFMSGLYGMVTFISKEVTSHEEEDVW